MTIDSIKLYRYSLPLVRPVHLGPESYTHRDGLVIELIDTHGRSGWGECAPLPFFSDESIDDSLEQLNGIRLQFSNGSIDSNAAIRITDEMYPSVAFGIESAVNHLLELDKEDETPVSIQLNGLITDETDPLSTAKKLIESGYRSIKIKVGRRGIDHDARIVRAIAEILSGGATLRLDANRAWSLYDAKRFCDAVRSLPIEYIEEPLNDSERLSQLAELTPVPVALDESFRAPEGNTLLNSGRFKAIVLKPMLTGGPTIIKRIVADARRLNMTTVISSAYETGLGINSLARMAAEVAPNECHGLDTANLFKTDLTSDTISTTPALLTAMPSKRIKVDRALLSEVTDD